MPVLQLSDIELVSLQTHLASSGPDSSSTCTMLLELSGTLARVPGRISQLAWPWPMAWVQCHALVRSTVTPGKAAASQPASQSDSCFDNELNETLELRLEGQGGSL